MKAKPLTLAMYAAGLLDPRYYHLTFTAYRYVR